MSINAIINNSLTGLFTNQAALGVTSNNIANINTPGYARQVVRQESIVSGSQSGGVRIAGIERIVDKFLVKATYDAEADFSRYQIERSFHDRIQAFLGRPDQNDSLSGKIDDVFKTFSELALNPLSTILKESAVSSIDLFGVEIGGLADNIQKLRLDASNQISDKISLINSIIERIDHINPLIAKETLTGGNPGSLIEKRSQALNELSSLIDISITDTGNNAIQVSTSSGVALVGTVRSKLTYTPPGTVTSSTPFSSIIVHQVDPVTGIILPSTQTLDGDILSGELKGLLVLRDKDLPEIGLELGNLASGFVDEINRIHNLNSAVPAPNFLGGVNSGLLTTDNHNFTGQAEFAVTDTAGNLVQKVTIDFGAIGATLNDVITAVNAGLGGAGTLALNNGVMSLTATNPADGVLIAQVAGNESSRAGRGFSHFFGMNDLVKSRVPAHFETGSVGTDAHGFTAGGSIQIELNNNDGLKVADYILTIGGASYNDLLTDLNASPLSVYATFSLSATGELVMTANPGIGELTPHVKTDSTSRGASGLSLSRFFGLSNQYSTDQAFDLGVVNSISENAGLFALARFDQTAAVGGNSLSVGDQEGALALKSLENTVFNFRKAGGLSQTTTTIGQYSAGLLADLGLRGSLAANFESDNKALKDEIFQKSTDISGVNLDEELSNMIIYQNAYSAAARILNTAQELFDDILRII